MSAVEGELEMMNVLAAESASGFYFRYGPIGVALGVLVPLAVLYAIFLYRLHPELSRKHRVVLASLRSMVYAAIILLLLAPVVGKTKKVPIPNNILVLLDVSESMSIPDRRRDPAELADAAAALGKIPLTEIAEGQPPELSLGVQSEVDEVPRLDLAKGVLGLPELEILRSSTKSNNVASYTFGERLAPWVSDPTERTLWLDTVEPAAKASRLGDALSEAIDRHGGQSITGVIVLSDGASNEGIDAADAARQLGERSIPVHTIGLGLTEPDDVRIKAVLVADTVFYKDRVPVRVLLESHGFQGRVVELELSVNEAVVAKNKVVLRGEQTVEELSFVPEQQSGQAQLTVTASVLPGDVAPENNRFERSISIIDDKIKILYVEAEPRWEYRYLRAVLLRDHRLDVKFLLTEGDLDLARASEQYLEEFPEEPSEIFEYDLIIVGDVPADYFSVAQLALMEELVSKRGGSFLMLAGRRHAPASYRDSPIAKLLPVKIGIGGHDRISPSLHPVPTEKGMRSLITSLSSSEELTRKSWARVKPLYGVPSLDGVKKGAADNVLITLSDTGQRSEPYPLVVWQRYGTGKALFVGSDQFWRLRIKHGDEFHARFWKQGIQFLTLSRLLGENKRIRLETERRSYRAGERVNLYANVLDESFEPVEAPHYQVLVESPGQAQPAALSLGPIPGSPGLFQGSYVPEKEGSYLVKSVLADADFSNTAAFQATGGSREMLESAMQEQTLRHISQLSGGEYLEMRDLVKLPELLEAEVRTASVSQEFSLWDRWYIFVFILACLAAEWFVRRQNDAA
jgi:hypothetical protein